MSIRHDGPRPRRCVGGAIRGVINNVGGSRSLFDRSRSLIAVTVQLTSTRLAVWNFVDDTSALLVCDMEHRTLAVL